MQISIKSCVSAIGSAAIFSAKGLQLEMSVGLAVFHMHGKTNKQAKSAMMDLYVKSGYDCADIAGADYKSKNRRTNAAASLFNKLTSEVVSGWAVGAKDAKAINAILSEVEKLNLKSIEDVKEYSGVPTDGRREKRGYSAEDHPMRRQNDAEYAFIVDTQHIHIGIPSDVSPEELEEAAKKLLDLAKTMKKSA